MASIEPELDQAVRNNDVAKVKELLPLLENPGRLEWNSGRRPLHTAAENGYVDIIEELLNGGVDINSSYSCTALHVAVKAGKADVVKLLLSKFGLDIDKLGSQTFTSNYAPDVPRTYYHHGQAPWCTSQTFTWSALHCAAYNKNLEITKMLLEAGADATIKDNHGKTAGQYASGEINAMIIPYQGGSNQMIQGKIKSAETLLGCTGPIALERHKQQLEELFQKGLERKKEIEQIKENPEFMDPIKLEKAHNNLKQLQKDLQDQAVLEREIRLLEKTPEFVDDEGLKALRKTIDRLDERIRAISGDGAASVPTQSRSSPVLRSDSALDDLTAELACCICLEIPRAHVFTCQQDHILCAACNSLLKEKGDLKCPMCKEDLVANPPRRSVGFERIIQTMRI